MNLLDSIDDPSYSLLFPEEMGYSKPGSNKMTDETGQSGQSRHTILNMTTPMVTNGSYNCDKLSEGEQERRLIKPQVDPASSSGIELYQPPNLRNSYCPVGTNRLSTAYNIEHFNPNLYRNSQVTTIQKVGETATSWGPDVSSNNLSAVTSSVNSYSEGQKILPNYFSSNYSDVFGKIANLDETEEVGKVGVMNAEDKMFLIGLSNEDIDVDDIMDNEDQGSSSPFHSATEDMGGDGDGNEREGDQDPLLIRAPPKQNVFHQFIRSAKTSTKNRIMRHGRRNSLKTSDNRDGSSGSALIKQVESVDDKSDGIEERIGGRQEIRDPGGSRCSIGILLAAISCFFFATSALIVKISDLHPMELLAVRGTIQGILVSPILVSTGNSFLGPRGSRSLLLARAVLGSVALVMGFASIHLIPLADAATVIFTSPVFVSIFACCCLGERCSFFDVSMTLTTIVGVLLVSKPSFSFISTGTWTGIVGTICGLIAAMLTALAFIVIRQLKQVHYSVTVFFFSATLAIFGAVLTVALDGFKMPRSWASISQCLGIGFCGFMGQILLTKALQSENALPIAVTRTLDIVLAFFYQITLLHDSPDWYSYLGSFLVVSCVLLTAFHRWYKESTKSKYTRVNKVQDDFEDSHAQPLSPGSTHRLGEDEQEDDHNLS